MWYYSDLRRLSTEDKSDWTFEEIFDYGYELHRKGLFSVKNWEVRRYLETFSNLSIKPPELPLFKEEVHQKIFYHVEN